MLEKIIIEPKKQATASIIWLHGLGADGHDFEPMASELGLSEYVRFIFPHAPIQPITVYDNYKMRAWYDIVSRNLLEKEDKMGICESAKQIENLIGHEIQQGISSDRIVLAGFSQGGAITFQAGLRYPERLAGLLVLSSYLPLANTVDEEIVKINREIPIMMAHGTMDNIIPIKIAQKSRHILTKKGYLIEWHDYPMQHSVCSKEVEDIKDWLKKILRS